MSTTLHIDFAYGRVISFDQLSSNSIALDGAVQGPRLDPASRRYSFDHHDGCSRFATLASCQQVLLALKMGLAVDDNTLVLTNDIDADTVVSVWLLENPAHANDARVEQLVQQVGLMDAHFMGEGHPMHFLLTPRRGKDAPAQSIEMLREMLVLLDRWYSGDFVPKTSTRPPVAGGMGLGWNQAEGWGKPFPLKDGFKCVYGAGFTAGITWMPAADGTWLYTVAKRSDFVQLAVGPGHVDRAANPAGYREDTLLGRLGLAELVKNPNQDPSTNWGGGSCIGGSPRIKHPDGDRGSRLTPEEVIEIALAL